MRAPNEKCWFTAVELGATVPATCKQRAPRQHRCRHQVRYLCDRCEKPVCQFHLRDATMPRASDLDDGRGSRSLDYPELEICVTCSRTERHYGVAIDELSDEQLAAFLETDDGVGYATPAETTTARDS